MDDTHADSITHIGPSSGSSNYGFTGDMYYGQVSLEVPYDIVYWYVKSPGDTSQYGVKIETLQNQKRIGTGHIYD